ncbi:MAG: hypothetical protein EXR79_16100 [Myxococcales bacterium]|nr:hypothetical protein [Myxococcales bacterium]
MPIDPLPLLANPIARCGLHPALAAAWVCAKCQRGHCGPCQRRTDRRTTPLGTCLQCGGALQRLDIDSAALTTPWGALRQAYSPLGLACAAALAVPMLYAGFVVTTLPFVLVATAACAWTYFLGVVRWRATAHAGLPAPAHVIDNLRGSMAALTGFLAVLIAVAPAVVAWTRGAHRIVVCLWVALALAWLPVPVLAAAARGDFPGPLLPLATLRAVRDDLFGYAGMMLGTAAWSVVAFGVAAVLAMSVGRLPGIGPWLVTVGALPGLWAVALALGRWGERQAAQIGFEEP